MYLLLFVESLITICKISSGNGGASLAVNGLAELQPFLPALSQLQGSALKSLPMELDESLETIGLLLQWHAKGTGVATSLANSATSLPKLNSARWVAALSAACDKFNCGGDVLRLAVLATTAADQVGHLLRVAESYAPGTNNDLLALLTLFDGALRFRDRDVDAFARKAGFQAEKAALRILKRAVVDFAVVEHAAATLTADRQRQLSQRASASTRVERICKAVLVGWPDSIYVSREALSGRRDEYVRLEPVSILLFSSFSICSQFFACLLFLSEETYV